MGSCDDEYCVDALHFTRDKGGKCQFQQCNGVVARGGVKGYDSYLLQARTATTTILLVQGSFRMIGAATQIKSNHIVRKNISRTALSRSLYNI